LRRIDSLVGEALRDFEPDLRVKRNRAVMLWESIAGAELSSLARPLGFRGSVLILRVLHPAAAMELRLRKKEILDRMNSLWGQDIFDDLRTVGRK
jgi:hypothetical protein